MAEGGADTRVDIVVESNEDLGMLAVVSADWAGPITCCKLIEPKVS